MSVWQSIQKNKKYIGIMVATIIVLLAIILIGPLDIFSHGFYCDIVDWDWVAAKDFGTPVQLENGDFEMDFSPIKDHFVGFGIYLLNQPVGNTGSLIMTICNENRKQIDSVKIDLSKVSETKLCHVYVNTALRKGEDYILKFSTEGCSTVPYLPTIDKSYLSGESKAGNIFLGGGYAESTFTWQNKFLIILFILAVYGFICAKLISESKAQKVILVASIITFMTTLLSWNYMYNSLDNSNTAFSDFQYGSERLVRGCRSRT